MVFINFFISLTLLSPRSTLHEQQRRLGLGYRQTLVADLEPWHDEFSYMEEARIIPHGENIAVVVKNEGMWKRKSS